MNDLHCSGTYNASGISRVCGKLDLMMPHRANSLNRGRQGAAGTDTLSIDGTATTGVKVRVTMTFVCHPQ